MMHWVANGVILAALTSIVGCVSSPTVNWASEKIGFTRAPQLGGTETLWIMNGDGTGQSQLNVGAEGHRSLTWSPDGHSIAFESVRDDHIELYTARVVSHGDNTYSAQDIQRRTTNSGYHSFPSWSPDCAWLAFSSNSVNQNSYNIYQPI
jgi:Tol biopolymer transport system component